MCSAEFSVESLLAKILARKYNKCDSPSKSISSKIELAKEKVKHLKITFVFPI
jgi:hypothetical protein